MPDVLPILLIGLLGGVHCMGMCGGFVLAIAQASGKGRPFLIRQSFYYLGKTMTYAALGAVVGGLGGFIGGLFSGMQQTLSVGLGVILVLIGMSLLGWLRRIESARFSTWWRPLASAIGRQLERNSNAAALGLGLLNGLLPCGLVYGALALAAASGRATGGALLMAVFGLSTVPALFLVASVGALMQPRWRSRLNRVSGVVLILLGLITIARGMTNPQQMHDGGNGNSSHRHEVIG